LFLNYASEEFAKAKVLFERTSIKLEIAYCMWNKFSKASTCFK